MPPLRAFCTHAFRVRVARGAAFVVVETGESLFPFAGAALYLFRESFARLVFILT